MGRGVATGGPIGGIGVGGGGSSTIHHLVQLRHGSGEDALFVYIPRIASLVMLVVGDLCRACFSIRVVVPAEFCAPSASSFLLLLCCWVCCFVSSVVGGFALYYAQLHTSMTVYSYTRARFWRDEAR